jgi:NAD(P)-dependent dehydrogenase (short-subunit alcohol dehydrogenase family)
MAETHHLQASKLFSMKGKVAVVTGGGSGIGLMTTQALSANGTVALLEHEEALTDRIHRCKGLHCR